MTKQPFYSALTYLDDIYGISLDEDLFETYGMAAYKLIGNHDYRLKVIQTKPQHDPEGFWFVEKPCDLTEVEAITLPFETGKEISATDDFLAYRTYTIENWIEDFKRNKNAYYLPGAFVKFTELPDKIIFTEPYDLVNVLYKGEYLDCDDLPYISEKEKMAIAAYCAFRHDNKNGRKQKDANMIQIAAQEFQEWSKLCSQARVADSFSQNEMNEILDILTSFDVHQYNVSSTKPIK